MTAVESILRRARSKVEAGWSRACMAQRAGGQFVSENDARATKFSLEGAVWSADALGIDRVRALWAFDRANNFVPGTRIAWHDADQRTQGEVLEAIDRAIERVVKQGW